MQQLMVVCLVMVAIFLVINFQHRVVCVDLSIYAIVGLLTVQGNLFHGVLAVSESFIA